MRHTVRSDLAPRATTVPRSCALRLKLETAVVRPAKSEVRPTAYQDLSRLVHTPRAVHVPDVEASRATVLVSGAQRSIECIVRARGGGVVGRRPPEVVRARPRLGIEFRFRRAPVSFLTFKIPRLRVSVSVIF